METYRFQIGKFECISINDGYISNIPVRWFFANAPSDQLEPVLRGHGILSDSLAAPCNCLVVDTVILSHMHGDHVGGTADAAGNPFFPNARYSSHSIP